MEYTIELKQSARDLLRGKWMIAIVTALVASWFGVSSVCAFGNPILNAVIETVKELRGDSSAASTTITLALGGLSGVLSLSGVLLFVVRGGIRLGYAVFNLNLADGVPSSISDLFSQYSRFKTGLIAELLVMLYTFLWSLLLIIPGIIKNFSYAMTPYILAENPDMTPQNAMAESQRMMEGNRLSLFVLKLSFIGWYFLFTFVLVLLTYFAAHIFGMVSGGAPLSVGSKVPAVLTSIGMAIVSPYEETAVALFYRRISDTK